MKTQKKTILVLEDEKEIIEVIKSALQSEGFSVVTARSVSQAFSYLKNGVRIDLVWLDHYLFGKENGLDFVIKLRRDHQGKNLPVIVVSNTVSPEKIQAYLKLDVLKCYTKVDFKLDQIIAGIKEFLK